MPGARTYPKAAEGGDFQLRRGLGGSIILTGSIASVKGIPALGVYSATKAAIRSFVRTWTLELRDRKIRANVISPGTIDTPILTPLPRLPFSWRRTNRASSRALNCSSTAAPRKSDHRRCSRGRFDQRRLSCDFQREVAAE